MEHVILVDEKDNELGSLEKMEAHQKGLLHRAFSVLLFNIKGELLLQKRAANKYHSAGLWTNTCCSHPRPGEKIEISVRRRLKEEMGIDFQPLYAYKFLYRVELSNNLTEHELDYVFTGVFNGMPTLNFKEVEDWKYMSVSEARKDALLNPATYTHWFRLMLNHPELKIPVPV